MYRSLANGQLLMTHPRQYGAKMKVDDRVWQDKYMRMHIKRDALGSITGFVAEPLLDSYAVRHLIVTKYGFVPAPWFNSHFARFIRWLKARNIPVFDTLRRIAEHQVLEPIPVTHKVPTDVLERIHWMAEYIAIHRHMNPTMILIGSEYLLREISTVSFGNRYMPVDPRQLVADEYMGMKVIFCPWLGHNEVMVI